MNTELNFDQANAGAAELELNHDKIERSRRLHWKKDDKNACYRYDFSIVPNFGFLGSSLPLVKNVELKLSFDRCSGNHALIKWDQAAKSVDEPLTIHNCHAITEWVSSASLESHFEQIDREPIVYKYEESEVIIRALDKDDTNLRIDAIRGGNLPTYLFAAIIPQDNLTGTIETCATEFEQCDVTEFNITIDGQSVNGYPVQAAIGCYTYPLCKFLDTTNRIQNVETGETLAMATFKNNFIWSHKFECEKSSTGWIGINLNLDKAYDKNMNMVIWLVYPCALSIDKFNQVELIKL